MDQSISEKRIEKSIVTYIHKVSMFPLETVKQTWTLLLGVENFKRQSKVYFNANLLHSNWG